MRLYLTGKDVLALSPRAEAILKAYTTQAPEGPRSAFIDRQGRIVASCEQLLTAPGRALLAVERPFVERLRAHLAAYLDLEGARLEATALKAYHDLDGDAPEGQGDRRIPLGAGTLILTERTLQADVSEAEYRVYRLRHGLPLQGIDYDREMVLNVHGPEHVSFDKGCYLGQEIVARTHYLGRPPKRLVVRDEASCDPELRERMTSKTQDPDTGRTLGFVLEPTSQGQDPR